VQSRPVYVLATQQPGREAGLAFTLRTRVAQPQAEGELSRVCSLPGMLHFSIAKGSRLAFRTSLSSKQWSFWLCLAVAHMFDNKVVALVLRLHMPPQGVAPPLSSLCDLSYWLGARPLVRCSLQTTGCGCAPLSRLPVVINCGMLLTMFLCYVQFCLLWAFKGSPALFDQVLGRRRPDGSALISVSEMRDGIVTFEDEAEAARFGALLEADRQAEVRPLCSRCQSCCRRGPGHLIAWCSGDILLSQLWGTHVGLCSVGLRHGMGQPTVVPVLWLCWLPC
jgi:hypothetical protein